MAFTQYVHNALERPEDYAAAVNEQNKGMFSEIDGESTQRLYGIDWDNDAFLRKIGIKRIIQRNNNLLQTISHPEYSIRQLQLYYNTVGTELKTEFENIVKLLAGVAVPPTEAQEIALSYCQQVMYLKLGLMKYLFPYSFKGKKGINVYKEYAKEKGKAGLVKKAKEIIDKTETLS